MIKVVRRHNEDFEKFLRRFKKRCDKDGLVKEMRKREYYEAPSVRKRREACQLKKRIAKEKEEALVIGERG